MAAREEKAEKKEEQLFAHGTPCSRTDVWLI